MLDEKKQPSYLGETSHYPVTKEEPSYKTTQNYGGTPYNNSGITIVKMTTMNNSKNAYNKQYDHRVSCFLLVSILMHVWFNWVF